MCLEMPCAMTTAKGRLASCVCRVLPVFARGGGGRVRGQCRRRERRPARCGLAGSPTQVVRSFVPDRDQTCEAVEGTASEQAAKLAKIIEGDGIDERTDYR